MKKAMSLAMLCIALFASIVSADPIAIVNHSFENPDLSGGGATWTDTNQDWDEAGGPGHPSQFNELTTSAFGGLNGAFHLLHHVGMQNWDHDDDPLTPNVASWIQQDLTTNFAPLTTYTLTVAAGQRANTANSTASLFQIRDSADNILANGSANQATVAVNSWSDFSVSFTTGAVAPSGAIRIRLTQTDGAGRAHFDNVRLDATAIPEPTTLALLGLGGLGMLARRRRA